MPTLFDGDNLIVTLPEPDAFGVLQLSWREDVYEAWKDWLLANGSNFKYEQLFDTFGGNQLTPSLNAGAYFVVQNQRGWRFRPFEADHTVYAVDNLPAQNSLLPIMIPTIGGFTVLIDGIRPNTEGVPAGMAPQVEEIHGGVDRIVHVNTELVTLGNGYQQTPWNNWSDAVDDAEAKGLRKMELLADATVDRQLKNFEIRGIGNPTLDLNGQDMTGSVLERMTVTGTLVGSMQGEQLALVNVTDLAGIYLTVSMAGTIAVQSNSNLLMSRVGPAIAAQPWTLSMNTGQPSVAAIHNISGGMIVTNMDNAGDICHLLFSQGEVTIDASCVAGELVIVGTATVVNNSGGTTVTVIGKETEYWQTLGLDPNNPATVNEDGSVTVAGITIGANTSGVTPNRSTVLTRT